MAPSAKDYSSDAPLTAQPEFCTVELDAPDVVKVPEVCGLEIKTMSYKGTGCCGEEHRKLRNKQLGLPDDRVEHIKRG